MLLDSNNYTTGEPLSVLLSPFYLPSPELTPVGAENPFDASTAFSQMAESDSEPSLPSPSVAGGSFSGDEQQGPLSPVYSDLLALIHVAFIVATAPEDGHTLSLHLLPPDIQPADIGPASMEWRLMWSQMAANLVLHLLEVAEFSSLGLPAFEPLLAKLPRYRSEIPNFSPSSKIAVTILCVLGARATSHSELFGVTAMDLENSITGGTDLASTVGRRRDEVCESLLKLALDLCDDHSVTIEACTLESLAALVQLFTVEEDWGETPDEVLHLAHSLYLEQLYACTTDAEVDSLKLEAGLALFKHDCISSSIANRSCEILHPADYLPSHLRLSLPSLPDPSHSHPLPSTSFADCFISIMTLIGGCQRRFSELASLPRPSTGPDPILESIPALWLQVDHVRTEIQRRQRALESRAEQEQVETQVLVGIKADLRLVELLMVVHGFVLGSAGKDMEMRALVEHSELRMRKCLKLISYYAKVYTSSIQGRPLLYRVIIQLELLPNWTSLALQRLGDSDAQADEYEVSETELDWLTTATRTAQLYTSLASPRYAELVQSRHHLLQPLPQDQSYIFVPLETNQVNTSPVLSSPTLATETVAREPAVRFCHYEGVERQNVALVEPMIEEEEEEVGWEPAGYYVRSGEGVEVEGEWVSFSEGY